MKRTLLILVALLLAASVAHAYVQAGHLPKTQKPSTAQSNTESTDPVIGANSPAPPAEPDPANAEPVRPVPEPGTMALASMGLIALGAAARWSRRNE